MMPSAKPDKNEIYQLRQKRGIFSPGENIFARIFFACVKAIDGGYIDQGRAKVLLAVIKAEPKASNVFPNTLLLRVLETAVVHGQWSTDVENTLLKLISGLYFGEHISRRELIGVVIGIKSDFSPFIREMSSEQDPEHVKPPEDIYEVLQEIANADAGVLAGSFDLVFDQAPDEISLQDRFVGFTGEFRDVTRKECFAEVRELGGVPSEPAYYLDYLFVSESHSSNHLFSNQLQFAIYVRRTYGNPLIFKESVWRNLMGIT